MRALLWWLGLSFYVFALSGAHSQAWGWTVVWWMLLGLWVLVGLGLLVQRAMHASVLQQIGGLRGKGKEEGKT